MRLIKTLMLAILVLLPCTALAGQPRLLSHYVHQRWIEGSEAPVPVLAMAQGRDGFLWLATGDGLFRFDGLRFEQIKADQGERMHDPPSALLVARNGDVWTNFETTRRFAVYRRGALHLLDAPPAPTRVVEMAEGADGAIWALTATYDAEVLRYLGGRWRTFNSTDGLPENNAANMLVAADGTLWIACVTAVVRLRPGTERFEVFRLTSGARVTQDAAGRVWISEKHATYPVTGPGGRGAPPPLQAPLRTGDVAIRGAPSFDQEGNLWVATRYHGVKRLAAADPPPGGGDVEVESFTRRDGLSSDVTNQILEDREGNIWVGTEGGLDRFRAATLVAEPALSAPAAFGDKLLEAADGSVYIGQARTLFRVRPHGVPEPILHDAVEPESLRDAPDGALWIGMPARILVWSGGDIRQVIERPDRDANHNIIYDCAFDAQGNYWISAAGGGLHRYRNGEWEQLLEAGEHADFYPTTMARTPGGGVVVQSGSRLVWIEQAGRSTTKLDFGDSALQVITLHTAGGSVFAAGAFGLSRHGGGAVETAWSPEVSHGSRINGIVETPEGELWLAYPKALARLSPDELARAFASGVMPAANLSLGPGDGLSSRPHSHSQRSMVRGGDGRLWIATETGTLWMDPARIVRNPVPPGVAITSINSDGHVQRDPVAVSLPAATSKIEIGYAVLNFSDQRRVQARYMLDGFDRDWVYPGQRRQAFYTNLAPGKYTFRVMVANEAGVWNPSGAALDFEIPRTFFQSIWFLLLCLGLVVAAMMALHHLRVSQAANRIQARLEERNAERERIARELHDTLLQGVMGLILRFHSVASRMPHDEEIKGKLESALADADAVVVDARKRVQDLRSNEDIVDIFGTIKRLVAETPFDPPIPVRIVVEGKPQFLHPLVSMEIANIVREALLNIAHHASASSAEIAIGFEPKYFAVRIRDHGIGFPEQVLIRGHKDGHFGLIGMRERAEKIGGGITISSSPGQGAEVILTLPARLAYAKHRPRRKLW